MWRKAVCSIPPYRPFSSSAATDIPTLYSFLQPSIFALKPNDQSKQPQDSTNSQTKTLTEEQKTTLQTTLEKSLLTHNTDEAWKSFKSLTICCTFPNKPLTNSLITHLSSLQDTQNLKRAFASVIFVIEKDPKLLSFETVTTLLSSMNFANTAAPAFALIKCMFKNRYFVPFGLWGNMLVDVSRKSGSLVAFLRVFEECCRIAIDEKLNYMKPDLAACNAALECCCCELESVSDAEKVVATMSVLGVWPDESSFGFLSYLFALKGLEKKIDELEKLMVEFGFSNKRVFFNSLIGGYVKSGKIDSVSTTVLRSLREGNGKEWIFSDETHCEVVKGYLQNGAMKSLASLIIEAQKLESPMLEVDKSFGYGIISACINLGLADKAHSILDEMNAQSGSVGLGVYVPILKAYSKEHRTAEATQLVMDIGNSGLQLDAGMYDMLIEVSMTSQDFQSAFTLFRDMRDARILDLKGSYLTIMTGLMENQRPELMAAFLDEVVEDPRIEVKTHDWNSIIHAFCKAGRLEDARRTFRRMTFLQFEPNDQTYLSLINGYVTAEKYFSVLMLWNEIKRKFSGGKEKGINFDHNLVDAFLYALVKGGFFDAVMQVVEKSQEMKIFVDKWSCTCNMFFIQNPLSMSPLPAAIFISILFLLPQLHKVCSSSPAAGRTIPTRGTCNSTCGAIPVMFPFGTGFGCGHPYFARYVKCNAGTLQFSTGTGIYPVSSIDYPTSTIVVADPFMSTCSSMQNSGSFSLDRTSPFTLTGSNIFVLLGCSTTSPVFDPSEDLCDTGSGSRVCSGLYSCKGVTGIGLPQNAPTSTCCVYDSLMGIGSGYSLDLPKLQCSSYTSIFEFGDEGDPMKWKFGISLQYNDSYYTPACKNCETSGGLCGFSGLDESFSCICRDGVNTTTNCFGHGYTWSGAWEPKIQTKTSIGVFLLWWIYLQV
ncbi:hypothetical protein ES319_D13G092000v1 [Gossypium barbadense]|uniref:non-specific serine/threonine protein kinase n=4 Tax=Gossypium TaxID=3633 RepID=A0A5J5NJM0_GOSBA|nr:hypothetical protein ES319_D13G092000v1 [Gossypium barbadense]